MFPKCLSKELNFDHKNSNFLVLLSFLPEGEKLRFFKLRSFELIELI